MHCCNNKQLRMMSSISSSTMASLPSLAYSLRDTEDLYCDDELHPSLENDPNMRLYTEDSNIDNQAIDFGVGHTNRIFDIEDDGKVNTACDSMINLHFSDSIFSMEIPRAQSVLSYTNTDTESFISNEDRVPVVVSDVSYSTVLAWGVDQNTDISSDEESTHCNKKSTHYNGESTQCNEE